MNFISAGLKKAAAAEDGSEEDSEEDEKPAKQEEMPKEFVPKKLKTVSGPGEVRCRVTCSWGVGGGQRPRNGKGGLRKERNN